MIGEVSNELTRNQEIFFANLSLLILVFAGWVVWKS